MGFLYLPFPPDSLARPHSWSPLPKLTHTTTTTWAIDCTCFRSIFLRPHPNLHGTLFTDCFLTTKLGPHLGLINNLRWRGWPVTGGSSTLTSSLQTEVGKETAGERRFVVSRQELEGTRFQGFQFSLRARQGLDGHGGEKWSRQTAGLRPC